MTRSSPARLPLCATAAACAWRYRPTFTARIGLPIASARSASARNRSGPLEALDEQHDRVRLGVVEAVGEVVAQVEHDLRPEADTIRLYPIRVPGEWMNASVTLPDWARPATWPRGSHGFTSPM